jgi:hypothetical protein
MYFIHLFFVEKLLIVLAQESTSTLSTDKGEKTPYLPALMRLTIATVHSIAEVSKTPNADFSFGTTPSFVQIDFVATGTLVAVVCWFVFFELDAYFGMEIPKCTGDTVAIILFSYT